MFEALQTHDHNDDDLVRYRRFPVVSVTNENEGSSGCRRIRGLQGRGNSVR